MIEWGAGLYGVEAAAQASFGVTAADIDGHQAALLAAVLPNPLASVPARPTRSLLARAALIERRAASVRRDPLGAAR